MKTFLRGIKAGLPIGLGYLSVSFSFGIIAASYGFAWWQAVLISMLTVTSAGQFAGIQTMLHPGLYLEMLISQITINLRYAFMSISLSQKTSDRFTGIRRWLLGFMMTDEIFAVASREKEVCVRFFAGLSVLPYIGWTLGTLIGALLGNILPHRLMSALSVAIYGMFVAIVIPAAKESRAVLFTAVLAGALSCAFTYLPFLSGISGGLVISICAVAAAAAGACFFPVPGDPDNVSDNDPGDNAQQ